MKNYLLLKYIKTNLKQYIYFFLILTIILFILSTRSFGEENVFTIKNVKVKGSVDLNFSRDTYLNKAFSNSFELLMNKILLTRDLQKVSNTKLNKIKKLINSFQIIEEKYKKNIYEVELKIEYNEIRIKNFLREKNISFALPQNITAVFFPLLYVEDQMVNFNENFFYKEWQNVEIKNELINFILPIEDLDDISRINKMKNRIEDLNIANLVSKYDINNYVFALMNYRNEKLNIYLKTNFNNNKISKNIFYKIKDINNELLLANISKNLKLKINDLWKEENLINLFMPLSIEVKFLHTKLKDLDKIRNTFYKISIIDNYKLEEFNINHSYFKLYYYGDPKKLKSELIKFGYELKNDQGHWQIYLND